MEIMKSILERRSIRKFTSEDISQDKIEEILKAGMYAPSAGNQRPWEFIVLKSSEMKLAVCESLPHGKMLADSAFGIVVCADLSKEKFPGYWVQDCSAAMENMLLASHSMGIGSVWLGIHPVDERKTAVSRTLGLPENVVPLGVAAFGLPAQIVGHPERFDRSLVHEEKWQK